MSSKANAHAAGPLPGPADALLLKHQLCFALYAASLAMTKRYRPLLAELGLTYPQYIVMLALWEHDTLSVGLLGEQVSLDSGTLAPLLKRLRALGLVERRRGADDDRVVLISLTAAGRALRERAPAVREQIACATGCSPAVLASLTDELHRLQQALRADSA